tara:strand:+ start:62 stop:514 length:453 start_codon:yes stop_codon:yes gene_type:complete
LKRKKSYIGIDPGKNGGISICWADGSIDAYRFPKKQELLVNIIEKIKKHCRVENCNSVWVIEDVHALFGSSAKATFSFGRNLGYWEGVLSSKRIKWKKVSPKIWQSNYTLSKDKKDRKNELKAIAQGLVNFKVTLATADAILIANWNKNV